MGERSRRALLASTIAIGSSLVGCVQSSPSGADSSPTESPTPLPPHERVTAGGSVVTRATADNPLRVEYRLTNRGRRAVTVQSGNKQPFVFVDRLTGPAGDVVLVPVDVDDVSSDVASSPTEGCWRFRTPNGADARLGGAMDIDWTTIDPGETYAVRHDVYYEGDEETCFSPGGYSATTTVSFGGTGEEGSLANIEHALLLETDEEPRLDVGELVPCESYEDCYRRASTTEG